MARKFFISQQKPEAVFRDIGYFNWGSAYTKRCGFHIHAPVQGEVLRGFHVEKDRQIEQVKFWLKPIFGFAVLALHMNMHSRFLPRKKEKSETGFAENCWTQCQMIDVTFIYGTAPSR
jgi:hypothetical protein